MAVQGQGINNAYNQHHHQQQHHHHHHQHSQQQPAFNNSSNSFHNSSRFDPNLNNAATGSLSVVGTPGTSNNTFENIILVGGSATSVGNGISSLLQLDDPDSRYLNAFTDDCRAQTQPPPPSYESLAISHHHHHHTGDYQTTSNNNDFILQDNTGNQIIFHRNDPTNQNRLYHQQASLVLDDTDENSAELVSDVQAMIDDYGLARNYETSSYEDSKNEIIINQFDILGDEQSQGIDLLIEQNPSVGYLIDQHSRQQSEEDGEAMIGPVLDRDQERLLLENTMSPLCEYSNLQFFRYLFVCEKRFSTKVSVITAFSPIYQHASSITYFRFV